MIELNVGARQGDSGGPIFDQQGELAGVLFGSGRGTTVGAYSGRIGEFLVTLGPDVGKQPAAQIASSRSTQANVNIRKTSGTVDVKLDTNPAPRRLAQTPCVERPRAIAAVSADPAGLPQELHWQSLLGQTRLEQGKTVLAAVGGLSLLLFATRMTLAEAIRERRKSKGATREEVFRILKGKK
jgi:hypothetical protein